MPETIWRAKVVKSDYPSLTEDTEVDVAIVGVSGVAFVKSGFEKRIKNI